MRRLFLLLSISILLLSVASSCSTCSTPEPEDLPTGFAYYRLDSLLMREPHGADSLVRNFPEFARLWGQVFGFNDSGLLVADFSRFVGDSAMQGLEDTILRVFPEVQSYAEGLQRAFARLRGRMPEIPIPTLYFYNSGFNASLLLADSTMGIGLDRFLGRGCWYYPQLGIPQYLRRRLDPEVMLPMAIDEWVASEYPLPLEQNTVLDNMLYKGKLKWLNTQIFPDMPDSVALGYSVAELGWLSESEEAMWQYLSEKKQLFETSPMLVAQYTRPAPFTTHFTQDSPGQAACYIGYRIVAEYMARNPETSLKVLFTDLKATQIVEGARYRPE